MVRAPFLTLCLALLLTAPTTARDEAQETRQRLAELESRISTIREAQARRIREQGALQAELRTYELSLATLARELQRTRRAQNATEAEIETLRERQGAVRQSAKTQERAVAAEIRAAYQGADNDQLRLLLDDDRPQDKARMLAYYRYVLGARAALVDEYRANLASLAALESELNQRESQLRAQRLTLVQQQQEQQKAQSRRQSVLAGIEQALADDGASLAAAQEEQAELDRLLQEIEAALAQLIPEDTVEAFIDARGSMTWPVDGRITERFGRPRNQGKMRWQGVRLAAEAGTTVSAIHHGRVVYADWLRGAGLLLVIDHGEGYMSLYANNESLLRDVGDWVNAGAAVATVGNSGGQSESGLYFEIRKDGKPTDPQNWCRG